MLEDHNKNDVYSILRWLMENFNELRMKDNLSLDNKRLRCNEYIAALLTQEFSKRLNRVITLGAKATIPDFLDLFRFSGELLIQRMHASGINSQCSTLKTSLIAGNSYYKIISIYIYYHNR